MLTFLMYCISTANNVHLYSNALLASDHEVPFLWDCPIDLLAPGSRSLHLCRFNTTHLQFDTECRLCIVCFDAMLYATQEWHCM